MKNYLLSISLLLSNLLVDAQVINFTPNANTIIISTNTTIGIGGGNFKTYLVCPGVTLSYAESSTMDTILLEAGATLKFDSALSYGYASIYAKNGATIDMNFRQTGKLTYLSGVSILDTAVGPPSFFMGKQLVTGLNYIYTNLPGGIGCAPNSISDINLDDFINISNSSSELFVYLNKENTEVALKLYNAMGQLILSKQLSNSKEIVDISFLANGMYYLLWQGANSHGSKAFIK